MRSHKLTAVLGLIVAFAFVGCSDDKSPTETVGSASDPEFQQVQSQVGCFVDSTLGFFLEGLDNMYALVSGEETIDPIRYGPVYPDSDFVSATYVNGWHVVYISRNRTDYGASLRDSIRFFGNGQVQQTGTDVDSLYYKHMWTYDYIDTSVSYCDYLGQADLTLTGLAGVLATINGTHDMAINSKLVSADSTVWRDFVISTDLEDFTIEKTASGWAQACPVSGSVSGTLAMTYKKDDEAEVSTEWTFSLSFSDGTMSATVHLGNTRWSYTSDVCTAP